MADPSKKNKKVKKKDNKPGKKALDHEIEQLRLKQWFASDKMHPKSPGKSHTVLVATDETSR
jgi:hypothetical protein